jgi:hypothetical protein
MDVSLSSGALADSTQMYHSTNTANRDSRTGTDIQVNNSTVVTAGASFKHAFALKENDFGATANGAAVSADTSGTMPGAQSTLYVGARFDGNQPFGPIRRVAYYGARLPNARLQSLTS